MSFYETYERDYTGIKEQNRKSRKECDSKKNCQDEKDRQKQQEQENTYRF